MTDTELRIAMIGCGRRAPAYVRTMQAAGRCRVAALCDHFAPRVRKVKEMFGDESIREYTDHRRMLDDGGFDAVFVVTEPERQAELSVEVMEAGMHAFSEVPVTFALEDCWKLVAAAERTGRIYYLGEQIRHTPLIRHWREIVRRGRLGAVLFAEGHYIHAMGANRYWRHSESGEPLTWEQARETERKAKSRFWDMPHPILYGPHELSPLLKALDDRVVSVSCYSTGSPNKRLRETPFPCQTEDVPEPDIEVALMQTAKGAILRFAAGFTTPVSESHWYHLLGTRGEVETRRGPDEPGHSYYHPGPVMLESGCRFPRTKEPWFHAHGRPPEEIAAELERDLPPEARTTGHGGADYYPVADFVAAVLDGATPDIDVYQAVDTAAPCILAARSAEQGGARITVPDFRPGPHRKKGETPTSV